MIRSRLCLVVLALLLSSQAVAQPAKALAIRTPEGVLLPDLLVTPGAINPRLTAQVLCQQTFTTRDERKVTRAMKRRVCALYGVSPCDGHVEIDHLISLELGGANDLTNLWPQPYAPAPGARQKDVLENWLHKQVCTGEMTLEKAQQAIRYNWFVTYKAYLDVKRRAQ